MKRMQMRWAAVAALAFGLGFGATTASAADPDCYSACQEQLNDCIAQAGNGSTRHCGRMYRECTTACSLE
ncbi:hypothetical protein J5226_13885 [Lysobacter sp. K5869]|uniref:hypothetical protein n=1 Tax=Lysobacter sp. K5869 TaxID=2820808 RepID=UPI001C062AC4|nr:hypothetical protein [Lysobacter sp. K5869]QWP74758.1 hypothetical protein J5226_13885 [Lysobacter sp. K5869]